MKKYCKDFPAISIKERLKYLRGRKIMRMLVAACVILMAGFVVSSYFNMMLVELFFLAMVFPTVLITALYDEWLRAYKNTLHQKIDVGEGNEAEDHF